MKNSKWVNSIVSLWILALVSECATIEQWSRPDTLNEGITDYRFVLPNDVKTSNTKEEESKLKHVKNLEDRYITGEGLDAILLKEDDSITIILQQGFIASFLEFGKQAIGEIAVVARAQELKEDTKITFTIEAAEAGRVVYYSVN